MARAAGWRAIAARRRKDASARYYRSDAMIAVVDARGEDDPEGLVGLLAQAVEASGGALVVLVDADRESDVPKLIVAGATHYLSGLVTVVRLQAVLAAAQRHIERLGGVNLIVGSADGDESLRWRYEYGGRVVTLSPRLAQRIGAAGRGVPLRVLLGMVTRPDRRALLVTARRLRSERAGAFAHALKGQPSQRVAHHLTVDGNAIQGEVEWLHGGASPRADQRDPLTGLRNRAAALSWLAGEIDTGAHPAAIVVALGQFDRVNSAYGPAAGDALLGRLARRLTRIVEDVGEGDAIAARLAGTDFLIGLGGEGAAPRMQERAQFIAARIVAALTQPIMLEGQAVRLTARCGVAQTRAGDTPTLLLRRAGSALASARKPRAGTAAVVTASGERRDEDADRLESDLRLALTRREIEIAFQPQYRMADDAMTDDRMIGVEALARWRHPDFGLLGAGVLFAAAERSDYMGPLSAYIHGEALRIAARWPAVLAHLRLAINITAADIADADFPERFLSLADEGGFPRARLTVEVTEGELIENLDDGAALLGRMRDAGLAVAIDDFGTGYSSLSYLKTLPLDYLKIDSALSRDIMSGPRDAIIVRSIIQMARSLGLGVVAEGVETEAQRALLAAEGCDVYQGFLRSPAVSSEGLAALVQGGAI